MATRISTGIGIVLLGIGGWVAWTTGDPEWALAGAVMGGLGGISLGTALCLHATEETIARDYWVGERIGEEEFEAVWTPDCAVHDDAFCWPRTAHCPAQRERFR